MTKLVKLFKLLSKVGYWRALQRGVAAAIEHESFLRSHKFASVIDVGANKGQFALAVRAHSPDAEIVAFEPLEGPAATFEAVFRADRRVRLIKKAMGSFEGTTKIHLSNKLDSSSLLPIGEEQAKVFPGTQETGISSISIARLDDLVDSSELKRPVLLKIDVQGFELEVLRGAERALATWIDDIYVELSYRVLYSGQPLAHEVIDWLEERGFVVAGVYATSFAADGSAVQSDIHFHRSGVANNY